MYCFLPWKSSAYFRISFYILFISSVCHEGSTVNTSGSASSFEYQSDEASQHHLNSVHMPNKISLKNHGEDMSTSSKFVDSSEHDAKIDAKLREVLDLLKGEGNKVVESGGDEPKGDILLSSEAYTDKALFNEVLNLMQISKNNADVITQAFRFVRLDAHLSTLLTQLAQLSESQESLHAESIKQQTKFNLLLDEIRSLAANVGKESIRLTEVEERLESEMEMMSDRLDTAIEKIIQSSVSTQILLDLSKETIQQTDKSVGISNEVLTELKSVRTELGDVGQASVQAIYNVQKLEESLLMAMEEAGNKTIYALRQDQQLQYQLLPLASPMRMDVDEVSLVPLGNGSIGNIMQADGTILAESTSLSAAPSSGSSTLLETVVEPSPGTIANAATPPATAPATSSPPRLRRPPKTTGEGKQKTQQNVMQDTSDMNGKSNGTSRTSPVKTKTGGSIVEKSLVSPPCPSHYERKMSLGRPRNCEEIQEAGHTANGVYRIYPDDSNVEHNGTEVYCDLLTEGGGWTVIQRRKEPLFMHEDFERTWQEYATGFGILHDSHWLGLHAISELTRTGDFQLRVDMTDWEGGVRVAKYGYFRIANGSEQFKMYVTDYSGDAGDSLAYHNGMPFTTKDQDNDLEKNVNCAEKYHGAWWYKSCHQSNLNGLYIQESNGKHDSYANGVNWYSWHGYYYSLKGTEMKIRSRHFNLLR